MAAYLIFDTQLTDTETYDEYKAQAKPIVESFDGEYLVRGGEITVIEDDLWTPSRMVILKFPTAERAREFHGSDAYQAIYPLAKAGAKRTAVLVEGV